MNFCSCGNEVVDEALRVRLERCRDVLIAAGELMVLIGDNVKSRDYDPDEELVQRLDEIEDRILAALVDEWREGATA